MTTVPVESEEAANGDGPQPTSAEGSGTEAEERPSRCCDVRARDGDAMEQRTGTGRNAFTHDTRNRKTAGIGSGESRNRRPARGRDAVSGVSGSYSTAASVLNVCVFYSCLRAFPSLPLLHPRPSRCRPCRWNQQRCSFASLHRLSANLHHKPQWTITRLQEYRPHRRRVATRSPTMLPAMTRRRPSRLLLLSVQPPPPPLQLQLVLSLRSPLILC